MDIDPGDPGGGGASDKAPMSESKKSTSINVAVAPGEQFQMLECYKTGVFFDTEWYAKLPPNEGEHPIKPDVVSWFLGRPREAVAVVFNFDTGIVGTIACWFYEEEEDCKTLKAQMEDPRNELKHHLKVEQKWEMK